MDSEEMDAGERMTTGDSGFWKSAAVFEERLARYGRTAAGPNTTYDRYTRAVLDMTEAFLHEKLRLPEEVHVVPETGTEVTVSVVGNTALAPNDRIRIRAVELLVRHHLRTIRETVLPDRNRIEKLETGIHDFVHPASHHLKTPLSAIMGFSGLLDSETGKNGDGQARHYIERILLNARLMEHMLNDLLYISRLRRNNEKKCDVARVAREVKDTLGLNGEDGTPVLQVQDDMGLVTMDPDHLKVLLQNIVGNAARFSRPGSTIEIGTDGEEFFVRDHGPGISKDNRNKAFHMFYTTCRKEQSCTGAGLCIVQKITELYGGDVRLESGTDGTTVYFRIGRET